MLLHAYAKINWALDTVGLRDDGYHLLDTIMQSISLHDDITIEPDSRLFLSVADAPHVPCDESNLILRAAEALRRHTGTAAGARITLRKRIPVGAGLGGGSTDAAAVLRALNDMWGLGLPEETLYEIGLSLGADVPFCLHGGLCRAQGIGEILTPFAAKKAVAADPHPAVPRTVHKAGLRRIVRRGQYAPSRYRKFNPRTAGG